MVTRLSTVTRKSLIAVVAMVPVVAEVTEGTSVTCAKQGNRKINGNVINHGNYGLKLTITTL